LELGRSLGQRPQRGSRDDDNLEACKRRLWLYRQNTMPLLKQLDEENRLRIVRRRRPALLAVINLAAAL
jgi:adenylate kinase family enzyme